MSSDHKTIDGMLRRVNKYTQQVELMHHKHGWMPQQHVLNGFRDVLVEVDITSQLYTFLCKYAHKLNFQPQDARTYCTADGTHIILIPERMANELHRIIRLLYE